MTAHPLIAGLLASRQILAEFNPGLVAWSSAQWDSWLERQCSVEPGAAQSEFVAVAMLTCPEDLPLHVGLAQLLATRCLRCTVVLTFPTVEMACLAQAQARRDEWGALVHVIAEAQLERALQGLPADAWLAVFTIPVILECDALARLTGTVDSRAAGEVPVGDCFLGRAEDFADWFRAQGAMDEERVVAALEVLLERDPGSSLGLAAEAHPSDGRQWVNAEPPFILMHAVQGGVEVSGLRDGSELVVSGMRNTDPRNVVVRQRPELIDADQRLRLRMPASYLTAVPQRIRVETRDADGGTIGRDFQFHVPPSRLEPWMISAFLNRGGGGNPVVRALAKGVGCRITYAEDEPLELSDIPAVWGVLRQSDRILAQAKAQGLYFFYIDHAYFNRGHGKSYRITRNAYEAGPVRDCPADRLSDLGVEALPWRKSGREIIVCPPTEYFMQAHGCADWLGTTLATLRGLTDRPITIRTKPEPGEETVPLPKALETAHALVTHSSNVAIEAACHGTPVFVDAASAAAPVGLTDLSAIESPVYPDRERWLSHLAYNQFSFEEIADGRAWRMLLELEERDFV